VSDKIEQVPLGHLQGMVRPEEYLWDINEEPPSLDDLPADPGEADTLPEPPVAQRSIIPRRRKRVIPQRDPNADKYAKLEEPLTPGEVALIMNQLRAQPVLIEKARAVEKRSRAAQGWGYVLGLFSAVALTLVTVPDYIKALQEPVAWNLPDWVPAERAADLQLGEVVTLFGAGALILLAFLSVSMVWIALLRALLLKRLLLIVSALLYSLASLILWQAVAAQTMSPYQPLLIGLALMLGVGAYEWILKKVNRG
jgi:hypothetical protein